MGLRLRNINLLLSLSMLFCVGAFSGFSQSISFSVNQIDTVINSCDDTIGVPVTIYNSGSSTLNTFISDGYYTHFNLYLARSTVDQVYVADLISNVLLPGSTSTSDWPWRFEVTPDGSEVWVTGYSPDSVYIFSTVDMSPIGAFNVGPNSGPTGIAFSPDGQFAYMGIRYNDYVYRIDASTYARLDSIAIQEPQDVAVTSDGLYAICVAADDEYGNIKIRLSDFTEVASIETDWAGDNTVCLSTDNQYAFVSRGWDGEIAIIDMESFTEVTVYSGYSSPHGIDITPDGKYVYCVNRWDEEIVKINASSFATSSIS